MSKVGDVLRKAALVVIPERGLRRGAYEHSDGAVCPIGAIEVAVREVGGDINGAVRPFRDYMRDHYGTGNVEGMYDRSATHKRGPAPATLRDRRFWQRAMLRAAAEADKQEVQA